MSSWFQRFRDKHLSRAVSKVQSISDRDLRNGTLGTDNPSNQTQRKRDSNLSSSLGHSQREQPTFQSRPAFDPLLNRSGETPNPTQSRPNPPNNGGRRINKGAQITQSTINQAMLSFRGRVLALPPEKSPQRWEANPVGQGNSSAYLDFDDIAESMIDESML